MVAHPISTSLHTCSPSSPWCHISGTLHIPEHSNVFLVPIDSLVPVSLPPKTLPYCSQCYSNIWVREGSFWLVFLLVCLFVFLFPSNHCICFIRIIHYFIFFILLPQISLHPLFSSHAFFNFNKNLI